jgi:mannose-6-phosphate isomerase-like protein (cupin superfamily)
MKHVQTEEERGSFEVLAQTARSQGATMNLDAGESTGGADNVHPRSDQWLYVAAGSGRAVIDGREIELGPGSLLLIEAGEKHEIVNTGAEPLRTVNVYSPPVY